MFQSTERAKYQNFQLPLIKNTNTTCAIGYWMTVRQTPIKWPVFWDNLCKAASEKKCLTILEFNEARDEGWQWHQLAGCSS